MKKYIILLTLFNPFFGFSQCFIPTNLSIIDNIIQTQFNWNENGSALAWEITVIPNFDVGTPLPTVGSVTTLKPYTFTNLPQGCNAFFVRSQCAFAPAVYSNWAIILSFNCSPNAFAYAATLSNNVYDLDELKIKLYPNPTNNFLTIETANQDAIDAISIYNTLGQEVLTVNNPSSKINVENLKVGTYFIKVKVGTEEINSKFIKN